MVHGKLLISSDGALNFVDSLLHAFRICFGFVGVARYPPDEPYLVERTLHRFGDAEQDRLDADVAERLLEIGVREGEHDEIGLQSRDRLDARRERIDVLERIRRLRAVRELVARKQLAARADGVKHLHVSG